MFRIQSHSFIKQRQIWFLLLAITILFSGLMAMSKGVYAQEPEQVESEQSKQAEPEKTEPLSPFAVFTDVALKKEGVTVSILWPAEAKLPDSAVLVSFDGQGNATDKVEVRPVAGETTDVALPNSIKNPWETGWSQRLSLETAKGEVLASQPVDITLLCEVDDKKEERCRYEVYLGAETDPNVVRISSEFDQALTSVEPEATKRNSNIVDLVIEKYPELRGQAYVYADQIAKLKKKGDCNCHWEAVTYRNPATASSQYRTGSRPRTWMYGMEGKGAAHWLRAYVKYRNFSRVRSISDTVSGTTQITLKVRCQRTEGPFTKQVWLQGPDGEWYIITITYYIITQCPLGCEVRFDHLGRYSGNATVWTGSGQQRPANRALAHESGKYSAPGSSFTRNTGSYTNPTAFDHTATGSATVASGTTTPSSTAKLSTYGYARAVGRGHSADARLYNSFGMAIHGQAACVTPSEAATWEVQSYEGRKAQMCQSINDFLAQWFIPPQCEV